MSGKVYFLTIWSKNKTNLSGFAMYREVWSITNHLLPEWIICTYSLKNYLAFETECYFFIPFF